MTASTLPLILIGVLTFPSPEKIIPYLRSRLLELGVERDQYEIKYAPLVGKKFAKATYLKNGKEDPEDHTEDEKNLEGLSDELKGLFYDEAGKLNLPTEEDWKRVALFLTFTFPEDLTSVDQTPNLKLVQLGSAGWGHLENMPFYKNIPKDHPLMIATASGIHAVPIPEHVLASVMMLYHNFPRYILAQNQDPPVWHRPEEQGGFIVKELRGRRMGILAYGHIARECARMGKAMGMEIVVATRTGEKSALGGYSIPGTGDHEGDIPSQWYSTNDPSGMKAFYETSDVIVNTLPSNSATKNYMSEQTFRQMRNDACFVNIGRGDTVDQEALYSALLASDETRSAATAGKKGDLRIGCASLDVTTPEPLPQDDKLWKLKNCVITPHVSGASELYWFRVSDLLAQNFKRVVIDGKGALNAVRGRGEDE